MAVEPLSEEDFQNVVKAAADDAVSYIDEAVAPSREKATAFYRGDPLGDEEQGRSKVVMTEVRDTVQALLPSLLRIFCGTEKAVEYSPRQQTKLEEADQATDYINHIFHVDNPGFQILYAGMKDALIRKTGIFKWYVDDAKTITESDYSGLTEDELAVLEQEDEIEVLSREPEELDDEREEVDPQTGVPLPPVQTYTARIRRTTTDRRFRVEAVPPEEFLIARDARDLDTASYVGHRRELPIADIVAMGYDADEILENVSSSTFDTNNERVARNPYIDDGDTESADPMMRKTLFVEHFIRTDYDRDGIVELRRVCTVGNSYYILVNEVWDDMIPFSVACPDPEPHMVVGYSIADQTTDIQEIKTRIVRNTLDSLAQNIHPRTVVVEGQVNMDDVLNTEMGAVIRARAPGMVQPLAEPFIGQQALGVLQYLDDVRAQRTGISRQTQGVDADVLQSTTKAAVSAMTQASEQRIEMIARIFAEGPIKRLFRGLLRMVVRHQDKERIIRLRGKFVKIDPKFWDADMDVVVNVGLGFGNAQDRLQALMFLYQQQQIIIQAYGPMNPLSSIIEAKNTLVEIAKIGGLKDSSRYIRDLTVDEISSYTNEQNQNKQEDPQLLLAKAEMAKSQADIVVSKQKADLEFLKAKMSDDRERDRMEVDMQLRAAELQMKYGAQVNIAAIKAEVDKARDAMDAQIKQGEAQVAQSIPQETQVQ